MDKSKERILSALQENPKGLTKHELYAMTACWNVGARVKELRDSGHDIKTTMEKGVNRFDEKISYARYRLA